MLSYYTKARPNLEAYLSSFYCWPSMNYVDYIYNHFKLLLLQSFKYIKSNMYLYT